MEYVQLAESKNNLKEIDVIDVLKPLFKFIIAFMFVKNCTKIFLFAFKIGEKIITDAKLLEIKGGEYVEELVIEKDGEIKNYPSDFAFLYLGTKNNTEMYGEFAQLDNQGNIITKDGLKTNVEGMYAIGDIRSGVVRQVTTAVADGTIAAMEAIKEILKKK